MPRSDQITGAYPNILLVGDAKAGKTRFMRTIPNLYLFDFDSGVASLRDAPVEYDTFKDLERSMKGTEEYRKMGLYDWGTGWMAFFKRFQDLASTIEKPTSPKFIAFDSLTFMSELAVHNILKNEAKGLDMPHQGTWGAHHQYFKTIFGMATALPVGVIATAHIERKENDLLQVTEKLPLLTGKMAGLIGAFFDEVYYLEKVPDPKVKGQQVSILRTQQTREIKAGSRWNVPDGTRADFAVIEPCFRGLPPTEPPITTSAPAATPSPSSGGQPDTIKL